MIIIMKQGLCVNSKPYQQTLSILKKFSNIEIIEREIVGKQETVLEIYLIGETHGLSVERLESLPGVSQVVSISKSYRILGRTARHEPDLSFQYQGLSFNQDSFHVFPGLCAVDNRDNVEAVFRALKSHGLPCARMGAFKPRTSPYAFQGLGKHCLDYIFDLAGHFDIKVVAMEVTHEQHIDEIHETLERLGHPTGVMLQIGTRNAQNFELLRRVGAQTTYPILFKRGFGITLNESLNAAEYLAHAGNRKVLFCLRGMKSLGAGPHRNFVDFAHVPVIKQLTKMPVCIDPSHAAGTRALCPDDVLDIFHITAQGVIAGANMVLIDFHPNPSQAMVDAKQALPLSQLGWFIDDLTIAREAYQKRRHLAQHQRSIETCQLTQ